MTALSRRTLIVLGLSALAAPASDVRWPAGLGNSLAVLRDTFDDHVAVTEAPGGTIDQLRERAPRLSPRIDVLADEHDSITARTERLADMLEQAGPERSIDDTEAIRVEALELLGAIARHRQLGADLLYEAYDVDVGGLGS